MRKVFAPRTYAAVPDGTLVSPFLNPFDNTGGVSDCPAGSALGIAAGRLEPGVVSGIHVLPLVTQVTWVVRGLVRVVMQGPTDPEPYTLTLGAGQAACTAPGELLQLASEQASAAEVLYVTSPAYVYERDPEGNVVYDDARVLADTWDALDGAAFATQRAELPALRRARAAAVRRLEARAAGR